MEYVMDAAEELTSRTWLDGRCVSWLGQSGSSPALCLFLLRLARYVQPLDVIERDETTVIIDDCVAPDADAPTANVRRKHRTISNSFPAFGECWLRSDPPTFNIQPSSFHTNSTPLLLNSPSSSEPSAVKLLIPTLSSV